MSELDFLLPWDSQPQEVVELNDGYPGAASVAMLIPFGHNNRDTVGGSFLTLSSGASISSDERGLSLKGSGSAAVASISLNLSAYNRITVSFWGYWNAFANDDDFFGEFTANCNSANGFYIDPNSSTTNFALQLGTTAGFHKTAHFPRPSAATWHHYQFTFDYTTGAGSSGLSAFVDGVEQALTYVNTSNQVGSVFASSTLYLFSRANTNLFGAGRMQNLVIRGGYVGTQEDALHEYLNPWQLFQPRSIWVPVSAGGGTNGNASTTPANSTLTAPTATGSGSAQASTAPSGSTLTAPTATATGTAAGHATATGAPSGLILTAPTATASGSAQASGEPASAPLTAPTGTASSAGHATASGIPAGLVLTAPTATATGSAQAFAAFITAILTAPTGTASNGEAPESGHSSTGYGGGGGSGHVGARERLRSRKALADLFEDIKLVKPKEKAPELTEHQEQTIQHALEVVREAQEAVRQTLEKLAEASPLPAQLKALQAKLRQMEADLEEEEAAVVSLLLL